MVQSTIEQINNLGITNSSARLLPAGTVCLSRTASVGYVVVTARPMATSQDFVNWVCGECLEPEFLKYLFLAEGKGLLRFASGAVHQTIYFPEAKAFYICIPSRKEQKRLIAVLDEVLAGIDTSEIYAKKNLKNAHELFQNCLDMIFSVPGVRWSMHPLRTVTSKIGSGATPLGGGDVYRAEGISLIRSLNVYDNGFRFANLAHLDGVQAARLSNVEVQSRDVLLNITGASVARCCVVPDDVLPARVNQHVCIIRPIETILHAEFLHYLLIARPSKERLLGIGSEGGSTRQAITKAQIQEFIVEFPATIDEQRSIVASINGIKLETAKLEAIFRSRLAALDELKRSMLHQAFSGKL